ncbi:MAG: DUF2442 domain-containing protein [Chloroflexi bacterium]|nr:DUF2442 domain-containing protein [Ardenticatenaceae bacterium]MBL1130674.1 DUF2442 domain-containing protein [Chloroflexota bacterium]NOG36768.1 DUF2442 domain-containing protein [Chloroflexota bacterium]GIK57114.1 MAG: molybdopterin-guanine dinucleotide biosynthesis protein MobA [Chloroflexota bacterium]
MLIDIVRVTPLANYELELLFEDGTNGIVNVAGIVEFTGVFASLQDRTYFDQVQVNPDIGTIYWPNEADIDPDVLYALITGEPLPDFSPLIVSPP